MKTDAYTRVVLTGILLCLVWICAAGTPVGTSLFAQTPPPATAQDVRIVGIKQPEMARSLGGGAAKPVGDWDSMPTYSSPQSQTDRVR